MIGTKAEILKWLIDQPDGQFRAEPYRPKRTLTQNAYFHVLVGKIAEKVRSTNAEIKNLLLSDYGVVDVEMGAVIIEDSKPWQRSPYLHLHPTANTSILANGRLYRTCYVMKGSHELNTTEMARLLDGTMEEAKRLGIETLPAHELERMRALEKRREEKNGNMEKNTRS